MSDDDNGPEVLVIDGANVVGSRPDGWWRDRAGAAARLHRQLIEGPWLAPRVVLVLEGQARAGVPETETAAQGADASAVLAVVHATSAGDDRIVAEARRALASWQVVAVVTADRGLSARVQTDGAQVLRPSWLLERLEGGR
jgi:hypothetical protein